MNLFPLEYDGSNNLYPFDLCAESHVDKHIIKMPLEVAQMLCTTIWIDYHLGFIPRALTKQESDTLNSLKKEIKHLDQKERPLSPYLPMMYNHPCTIWVRSSLDNFEWTHCYGNALGEEYRYRYGKQHKAITVINNLPNPSNLQRLGRTKFAMAMPDILKDEQDSVLAYRNYYHLDKATFASWSYRDKPTWWNEDYADYSNRITSKK